ncbi:hypothetical protein JYU34_012959 [Plutella xylostella]|uniref:FP protein C-terminal domain-containing protein n=1 Tax=Plutella xylostella TaxID=51655 RepID=A0ABQ7QCU5_PLUXY|nr:hypothetical protein JYU34_012959 [Plutella xylostella]
MDRSASESELCTSRQGDKTPPSYVATRFKRAREDENEMEIFKNEIKCMMTSLFANQEKELKKITASQKEIQQTNSNIESSIAFLTSQNEEFKKKIESLESKAKEDRKYICLLEDKIEDMQRDYRKTNFEIKNVPRQNRESKEDLIEMVMCLGKSVDCAIQISDIKDVYRVRGRNENVQNTPIIIETTSTLVKTNILKMGKSFNIKHKSKLCAKHLGLRTAEDTPIFISEHLTAKGSRLHFLARDVAKTKSYKFCWTSYGKVYLRKDENSPIILVKNETQAHHLLTQI